jgi:hypothetical protein
MPKVVTIAPMGGQPGLIAYECPNCAYVTSVLVSAAGPSTARGRGASPLGSRFVHVRLFFRAGAGAN